MPLHLSNQLRSMIELDKSSSAILRCLIMGLIKDDNALANSNAELLLKNYPIIEKACTGKLKNVDLFNS